MSCVYPPEKRDFNAERELLEIGHLKVYFGHQSVGGNVLDGLREIQMRIGSGPIMTDTLIGQNGEPEGKCEDFVRKFAALPERPDIALMKFCYIDFGQSTDEAKLFARYAATLDGMQAKYPTVIFVPVTTPLTTQPGTWKRALKKLLGNVDAGSAVNAKRAEFNRLLVKHYAGRVIFDLARVESTNADGTRNSFDWNGRPAYSMVDAYTSDGGHLNELGRRLAAEELIHTLARAKSARVSPAASGSAATSQ